jgi:hypothetical protein
MVDAVPIPQHLLRGLQHLWPVRKAIDFEMGC